MLCVSWLQVQRIGSQLWSSCMWRGATVTINVVHVLWSQSSCHVVVTGAACRVIVMVFTHMVWGRSRSQCSMCVVVAGVAHWVTVVGAVIAPHASWLLPLCCMWCCCRPFYATWGVASAFIALGVVLQLWMLCHVWCMQLQEAAIGWPGGTW
jgi:hypothetical protein